MPSVKTIKLVVHKVALKVALTYALFSALWITCSDQVLLFMVKSPSLLTYIQTIKGWLFILITSWIVYILLYKELAKVEKARNHLHDSEERYRLMAEQTGLLVYDYNIQTGGIDWSGSIEKLTGYTGKEFQITNIHEWQQLIHIDDREHTVELLDQAIKKQDIYEVEYRLQKKDGSFILLADHGRILKNDQGIADRMLGNMRDITRSKQLENQLRQAQKMEAIGLLAGGVAHDFNNMLSGIMGAAELLELRHKEDEHSKKLVNMILESAERSSALTQKLLSFARKQHPASSPIDLHKTITNSIELLENTIDRRITIRVDLQADSSIIIGDPSQLQNGLINLAINASHAMLEGGEISIITKTLKLDTADCKSSSFDITPGQYLNLEFRDTGTGISPENLGRIFDPFFTTKGTEKGTGLGLASVYGIMQQHKGAVTVESEMGRGTVFNLLFPLSDTNSIDRRRSSVPIQGTGTILVIDDEQVMRTTAKGILESLGYTVLLAENGEVGIQVFKENHAKIDAVILDMIMPIMNGKDCFAALKKIDPNVRGILSSGFSQEQDIEAMKELGLKNIIHKPYRSSLLSHILTDALNSD